MSEWNLSVRLTGQGSGLARTLRDLSRDANTASRNVTQLRRDIDELRATAADDIRIRLDLDADHLRRDVNAALTTAGAGQGLSVDLRLGNAMQFRREVEDAVRWAAWGHRIEIPLVLADPMQLRRDVSAAVRWASMNQTITVRVNPDTSGLNTLTRTIRNTTGGSGGGGDKFSLSLKDFILLAPAAVPLAAGLSATLAPLVTQFTAAGVAGAAFGIAIAGQIGPLSDTLDAETKYQEAVVQHGKTSKEAAQAAVAYQQQLAQLPPATQRASVAVSTLKTDFKDWSDSLAGFTMRPVTDGITVIDQLIPNLTPEVKSASTQLERLVKVAGGAVETPGFDAFTDKLARFTDGKLDQFTDEVIHLMRVLSEGGADHGAIAAFVDYARANGPAAREAIKAIAQAVITLLEGAAQAGPSLLTLVTAAARLVAALPPELVGIILHVAAALKLLKLSGAGYAALAGGIRRVRTEIGTLAATSAAAGGGLRGLRAAFLGLGTAAKASLVVAGIAAVALVVKKLSDIGKKAPPNVDKLTTALGRLGQTGKANSYLVAEFGENFSDLGDEIHKVLNPSTVDSINNWGAKWTNGLLKGSDASEDFKDDAKAIDESLTNLVRGGKAKQAAAALQLFTKNLKPKEAKKLKESLDGYNQALADAAFEQDLTVQSMGIFGQAAQETSAKLDAQKRSADGLRASIFALNDVNRSAYDAEIGFEAAIDDLTESFKKNGATLDLHTEKGRNNGQAMSAAAKAQDEFITAGVAAGESVESLTGKSDKLRKQMLKLATEAFDGNKEKAKEYVNTLLGTPSEIKTIVKLEHDEAVRGLKDVQAAIAKTPSAKSVKVDTLNAAAIKALEAVGLKTRQLPDGQTEVYTANGQSLGSINAVDRALSNLDGKTADTYTRNHITTFYKIVGNPGSRIDISPGGGHQFEADGGVVDYYADGGIQRGGVRRFAMGSESHVAQIAPAGAFRVWAEPETGGEGYVPFAMSKRPRSRKITEEIVRRLGGDPSGIQWNANGSIIQFAAGGTMRPVDAARQWGRGWTDVQASRPTVIVSAASASPSRAAGGDRPLIGSLTVQTGPNASAGDIVGEALFQARVARRRGVHR